LPVKHIFWKRLLKIIREQDKAASSCQEIFSTCLRIGGKKHLSLQPKLAYRKRNQSTKPKQYKKRQWWCCPGIDLVIEVAITSIAMCEAVTTSYDVRERSKQISIHKGISVKPNKQVKTKNGFGNMFLQNKLHITSNHKILDIVHHKLSKILKVPPTLTAK
jgi:hypothetical protein